tara:strand:+ start:548 stop:757 length:210 start_codon:yes stop_codon:yes gene_type:complete
MAMPTPALAHIVAAVVNPDMVFFELSLKMIPAPKKPIPETILATILVWSAISVYVLMMVKSAAPKQTEA